MNINSRVDPVVETQRSAVDRGLTPMDVDDGKVLEYVVDKPFKEMSLTIIV